MHSAHVLLKSSGLKALRQTRQAPARLGGLPGSGFDTAAVDITGFSSMGPEGSISGIREGLGDIFVTETAKALF